MPQPTEQQVYDIEWAAPGISFDLPELDHRFLKRMHDYGYLDAAHCRTSPKDRLRHFYRSEGLALFLGAGVSKASGIPDWRGLLDQLLVDMGHTAPARPDGRPGSPSELLETHARLALTAQFDLVAHGCGKSDQAADFERRLRERLYGEPFARLRELANKIPEDDDGKREHDWGPLSQALRSNTTLAALGDLVIRSVGGTPAANRKIHAVLTTNADYLLELYAMSVAGGVRLLDTVNHPGRLEHTDRISVYYLHGWLDMRDQREHQVSRPPLVFKESEYFDAIASPSGFANHTAQYFFQRRSVLFVGTSLEDLNVRRWLYNAFEARRRPLQALFSDRGHPGAAAEAFAASVRHFWLKCENDVPQSGRIKPFLEDSMRHLGVEILWYKDHADVAPLLQSIGNESGP